VVGLHSPASWHWSLAVQVTELPAAHAPASQVSSVHRSLSRSHEDPFALAGFEQRPVVGLHSPASWHWSLAVQVTALPAAHAPASQVSSVHRSLSRSHEDPLAFAGFEQRPVVGLHSPASWHWSLAVQVTELPAVHAPASQVSSVHRSLSRSHEDPFAFAGFEQRPVVGLHSPASWHWPLPVQVSALSVVDALASQVSRVHRSLSRSHAVPLPVAVSIQRPVVGLHSPASWHWSLAVQVTELPAVQAPASQVSSVH